MEEVVVSKSQTVQRKLDILATRIKKECKMAAESFRTSVDHAYKAGKLLLEVKATLRHGEFGRWIAEHCYIKERAAEGYMRVARHWEELNSHPKAVLTLTGGLKVLASSKPKNASESSTSVDADARFVPSRVLVQQPAKRAGSARSTPRPQPSELRSSGSSPAISLELIDGGLWQVHSYCGTVEDVLPTLKSMSADAGLTDSPYGIDFMQRDWDKNVPPPSVWAEVRRILKPGAFLLSFGGTRTWHHLATSMEQGGLEIRDTLMWMYGQGFPKSTNLALAIDKAQGFSNRGHTFKVANTYHPTTGKARPNAPKIGEYQARTKDGIRWQGYGTALKPAYEPIILARKPLDGTNAGNALAWGCGGLNIDRCRIGNAEIGIHFASSGSFAGGRPGRGSVRIYGKRRGRYPSNLILDDTAADLLDEVAGRRVPRFYYCPKVTEEEKRAGLDTPNGHPTLKPIALTTRLAKLLLPPARSTPRRLLVPYCGTFSEIIGAFLAGWEEVIGIEMNKEYIATGKARLWHWCKAA